MQTQRSFSSKLTLAEAAAATEPGQIVIAGDSLGISIADAAEGERLVLAMSGEHGLVDVVPAEVWAEGEELYYNETTGLITNEPTHWPVGRAGEAKAAQTAGNGFGVVQLERPQRKSGEVLYTVRIAANHTPPAIAGAVGSYTLRDFGRDVVITECSIASDGLTSGGSPTVTLGDGSGGNDQVLESTAMATIDGYDEVDTINDPDLLPAIVDKLVLSVAVASFTAGFIAIRARYVPAS